MERHFFVETEVGTIFEINIFIPLAGLTFKLEDIEDFDDWARESIHLSKIVKELPASLQGFFMGDIEKGQLMPPTCTLSGARRAWVEEW